MVSIQLGERGRKRKVAGHRRKAPSNSKNSCCIKQRAQGNIVPTRKGNGMWMEFYFLTWWMPSQSVGHVHHYSTLPFHFLSCSLAQDAELGDGLPTWGQLQELSTCSWSEPGGSESGVVAQNSLPLAAAAPYWGSQILPRGATMLDHPPIFPLPGLLSPMAIKLSCHFPRKIRIFPELKTEQALWVHNLAAPRAVADLHQLHWATLPPQIADATSYGAQAPGKPNKLHVRRPLHSPKADIVSEKSRYLTPVSYWLQDSADCCLPWYLSAVRRNYFWLPAPETVPCWAWSYRPSSRFLMSTASYNAG